MISVGRILNYLNHTEVEVTDEEKAKQVKLDYKQNLEYPIEAIDVTLKYGDRVVLSKLNFKIRARARIGIFGASGAGKHSIMNMILGIFKHDSGTLNVFGKPIGSVDLKEIRQ
jgi:ABC-type multidrug transport system fused ATPase/permease subunit